MDIEAGNLYDMNKQIMLQSLPIAQTEYDKYSLKILDSIKSTTVFNNKNETYWMLLCNERKDYSIFKMKNDKELSEKPLDVINDCFKNRGYILLAISEDSPNAYELWIRDEKGEVAAFYFFNYNAGVIEIE